MGNNIDKEINLAMKQADMINQAFDVIFKGLDPCRCDRCKDADEKQKEWDVRERI